MKSKNFKSTLNGSSRVFDKLSDEWWDENGSFKALHSFNLIRLEYYLNEVRLQLQEHVQQCGFLHHSLQLLSL